MNFFGFNKKEEEIPAKNLHLNTGWEFKDNDMNYKHTPEFLYNNNPWLIHYETYKGQDYPIVSLPQGMMLYNYFVYYNHDNNKDYLLHHMYKLHFKGLNKLYSKVFFYPIPYAGFVVNNMYDTCNIVYLNKPIRLLSLVRPSPIAEDDIKHKNLPNKTYYDQSIFSPDNDTFLSPDLMEKLNINGYINIHPIDSLNSSNWNNVLSSNKISKDAFGQIQYKAFLNSLNIESFFNIFDLQQLNPIKNILPNISFGVPEIVLNSVSSHTFSNTNMDQDFFINQLRQKNIKPYVNYEVLTMIPAHDVKDYLNSIAHDIIESEQASLFHLYVPKSNLSEFPYVRPMTYYKDLTFKDVDWLSAYTKKRPKVLCAFDSIIYHALNPEENKNLKNKKLLYEIPNVLESSNLNSSSGFYTPNSLSSTRKNRKSGLSQINSNSYYSAKSKSKSLKGGRERNNRSIYSVNRKSKTMSSKKMNSLSAFLRKTKTMSSKKIDNQKKLSDKQKQTNALFKDDIVNQNENKMIKTDRKPVLEMTKNYIPIFYWK